MKWSHTRYIFFCRNCLVRNVCPQVKLPHAICYCYFPSLLSQEQFCFAKLCFKIHITFCMMCFKIHFCDVNSEWFLFFPRAWILGSCLIEWIVLEDEHMYLVSYLLPIIASLTWTLYVFLGCESSRWALHSRLFQYGFHWVPTANKSWLIHLEYFFPRIYWAHWYKYVQ